MKSTRLSWVVKNLRQSNNHRLFHWTTDWISTNVVMLEERTKYRRVSYISSLTKRFLPGTPEMHARGKGMLTQRAKILTSETWSTVEIMLSFPFRLLLSFINFQPMRCHSRLRYPDRQVRVTNKINPSDPGEVREFGCTVYSWLSR